MKLLWRGIFLCDTALDLISEVDRKFWALVIVEDENGEMVKSANKVRSKLFENEDLRSRFRGDTGIIVPTNMILRNVKDTEVKTIMMSSIGDYDRDNAASLLRCSVSDVTFRGIDTISLFGREPGECSPVVQKDALRKLGRIEFADNLKKYLRRENSLLAFPLGQRQFLCMAGSEFSRVYKGILQNIGVRSNL